MAQRDEPSYTDLVYEVLRSAERPLTFQEVFDAVNRRRLIVTRNPKGTIRNALTQGAQLASVGDGRYGYLPHLVRGSLLRIPLTEEEPASHLLIYAEEHRLALWPSFFEGQKRSNRRPFQVRLPNGDEVALPLEGFGEPGHHAWGSSMPEGLHRYLVANRAAAGDSLLIRVVDAEAGRGEAWLEPRRDRDDAAVARRNQELADAVYQFFRKRPWDVKPIWEIVISLLARGLHRADVAPDPVETVLRADPRLVEGGWSSWLLAKTLTPEELAEVRQRQRTEAEPHEPAAFIEGTPPGMVGFPSVQASRYALERTLADIGAFLAEHEFTSVEEATAFLREKLAKGGPPRRRARTLLEQAQDLMYQAWQAQGPRERVRLARQALDISPDCADAYVLLAEETARSPQEAADLYARGVAAGERALGKEAFEEAVGHFWGVVETRPYMRARYGLAQALWAMGKREEAIAHAWDLLRLNPGDNQGARYALISWLLEVGDDAQVKKLLDRYPDDAAGIWLYARALHAFRTGGDTKRARKLLAEAKTGNPYVPGYLLGKKRLPHHLPEAVGWGDEGEAIVCAATQMLAWHRTPGALAWLEGPPGDIHQERS